MLPSRAVVFLFSALCFSESVLNGLFHMGVTVFSGVYCPGLMTALVLLPPLFWYLSQVAHRKGLLTNTLGVVAFLIAVVIHTVDVATSVFGVKLRSHRLTTCGWERFCHSVTVFNDLNLTLR